MSQEKSIKQTTNFNLVGTSFVKMFREYLISLIKDNKNITDNEIIRRSFLEKNVKPETTKRYLRELKEYNII